MPASRTLGFIVRSGPYSGRSGRDQLDMVLAASLSGWSIELFFVADGLWHLVPDKHHAVAGLPGTWRGWKSLEELAPMRCWVEAGSISVRAVAPVDSLLEFKAITSEVMAARLGECERVMAL